MQKACLVGNALTWLNWHANCTLMSLWNFNTLKDLNGIILLGTKVIIQKKKWFHMREIIFNLWVKFWDWVRHKLKFKVDITVDVHFWITICSKIELNLNL